MLQRVAVTGPRPTHWGDLGSACRLPIRLPRKEGICLSLKSRSEGCYLPHSFIQIQPTALLMHQILLVSLL